MDPEIIQDVVPPQKKSIRNIPLSNTKKQYNGTAYSSPMMPPRETRPEKEPEPSHFGGSTIPPRRNKGRRKWVWGGVVVLVLVALFVGLSLFDVATLNVFPRQETVAVNQTFTATKAEDGSGIPYQTIQVSGENGKVVPATGGEPVVTKASGMIIVSNNYSAEPQKLIANTRFESSDGLIYRIKDPITVPGQKTTGGSKTPGIVEVMVYADVAGPEYNKASATFTIPGLKGDPRFTGFSAVTKTALTGGFSGTAKKVDPAVAESARKEIQAELVERLMQEAETTVPEKFVLIPATAKSTFEPLLQSHETDTSVQINERLVLEVVMFNKDVLNDALLGVVFPTARGDASIVSFDTMNFQVPEDVSDTFEFTVTGEARIVWDVSESELQEALAGTKRKNLNTILSNFPAIERAEATVRPFWRGSFPDNPTEIDIIIEL